MVGTIGMVEPILKSGRDLRSECKDLIIVINTVSIGQCLEIVAKVQHATSDTTRMYKDMDGTLTGTGLDIRGFQKPIDQTNGE